MIAGEGQKTGEGQAAVWTFPEDILEGQMEIERIGPFFPQAWGWGRTGHRLQE